MPVDFLPPTLDSNLRLWRYMKVSAFLALLQGTAFFPSVATLKLIDPLEGDLHPEPDWLVGKLQVLSKSKYDELKEWLVSKGKEWERRSLKDKDQDEFFNSRL